MKRILILYQSQTGFTQTYAQWLSQRLDAPAISLQEYRRGMEGDYDMVLCGGGIYGNELAGFRQYRRIAKAMPFGQVIYFATGLRPEGDDTTGLLLRYHFGRGPYPPFFYLRGGLELSALDQKQQAMLTALKAMIRRKADASASDLQLLSLFQQSSNYCDAGNLQPLFSQLS